MINSINMVKFSYWSCRAGSRFAGRGGISMFYVYILKSKLNGDVYIGSTEDLRERFRMHNKGRVKSTKINKPWTLAYYEAYRSKLDGTKREFELKIHAAKNKLREQIKYSLEI